MSCSLPAEQRSGESGNLGQNRAQGRRRNSTANSDQSLARARARARLCPPAVQYRSKPSEPRTRAPRTDTHTDSEINSISFPPGGNEYVNTCICRESFGRSPAIDSRRMSKLRCAYNKTNTILYCSIQLIFIRLPPVGLPF